MVRLLGIDLPKNKRIAYALIYIHGIGLTSAKNIIEQDTSPTPKPHAYVWVRRWLSYLSGSSRYKMHHAQHIIREACSTTTA